MRKTTLVIIASLIVIAVVLFLNFRRGRKAPEIETAIVSRGDITISIFAPGELQAREQVELKFSGGGEVVTVAVAAGDKVYEGQFLAALDQQALKESLMQAEANLKRARADLDYAGETRRLFYEEHKYDDVSTEEIFAQFGQQDALVRAAVAAVEDAESQVESAKISLNNVVLNSPIAGTVVELNIKEGEHFDAAQPTIIVADLSPFVFEAEVDETDIGRVKIGQKAAVSLDAFPDAKLVGEVSKIEGTTILDSAGNKIVKVKIDLNLKGLERPYLGLSGDAEIIQKEKKDILLLPVEATLTEDGKNFVYLVRDGNKIVKREVKLGLENDDMVEVVRGVSEGEKVDVNPHRKSD